MPSYRDVLRVLDRLIGLALFPSSAGALGLHLLARTLPVVLSFALLAGVVVACSRSGENAPAVTVLAPNPRSVESTPEPSSQATGTAELVTGSHDQATPSAASASSTQSPTPDSSPTPIATLSPTGTYGCPAGPCPRSLTYAVNGCTCAGQIYEESRVTKLYCCSSGFSDSECPESLQTEAQLESTFGSTQEEVEAQLVVVELGGWRFQVHRKAERAFRQVAQSLERVNYEIREPIESYNWRVVEGHSILSDHAFGIAVDINPSTNPNCGVTRQCNCYNDLITDMPAEFVQAFKDAGFEWGGDWSDHPDPMHFDWVGWR